MSLHRGDWAALGNSAGEWFKTNPWVGLVLASTIAGILVTLIFTLG
jgi:hypothetical protein